MTVAQAFAAAGGDKSAPLMRWPRVLDGLFSATHAFANDRTDRSGKFNCLVAGRSKPGQRIIGLARQDIRLRAGAVRIHRFIHRIGVAWAFWVRTRRIFVWGRLSSHYSLKL